MFCSGAISGSTNHYICHWVTCNVRLNFFCPLMILFWSQKKKKARKHIADSDGQLKNRVFENEGIARDMSRNAIWNFRIQSWSRYPAAAIGARGMIQPSWKLEKPCHQLNRHSKLQVTTKIAAMKVQESPWDSNKRSDLIWSIREDFHQMSH